MDKRQPKYQLNNHLDAFEDWNNLDQELKKEVIKKLDICSMMQLRNSSRTERNLVDATKTPCHSAEFLFGGFISEDSEFSEKDEKYAHKPHCNDYRVFNFALNHGTFEKLSVVTQRKSVCKRMDETEGTVVVGHLDLIFNVREDFDFWMMTIAEGVRKITIRAHKRNDPEKLFRNEKFLRTPYLSIHTLRTPLLIPKIAHIWMRNGLPTGHKDEVMLKGGGGFDAFTEKLYKRTESDSERHSRISTNDPRKHILLVKARKDWRNCEILDDDELLKMTIIPADLQESQLDLSNEWAVQLADDYYYPDINYDHGPESEDEDVDMKADGVVFKYWHKLPDHLKGEVVKYLDFKTMFHLYNTSQVGRKLIVTSPEVKIFHGQFRFSEKKSKVKLRFSESDAEKTIYRSYWDQNPKIYGFILGRGTFEHLVVNSLEDYTSYDKYLDSRPQFTARTLKLEVWSMNQLKFWMTRIDGTLRELDLHVERETEAIFDMQKILMLPTLRVRWFKNPTSACLKVVQWWIDQDLSSEKKMTFDNCPCYDENRPLIPSLLQIYRNKIISKSAEHVKIRTNMVGKAIFIKTWETSSYEISIELTVVPDVTIR